LRKGCWLDEWQSGVYNDMAFRDCCLEVKGRGQVGALIIKPSCVAALRTCGIPYGWEATIIKIEKIDERVRRRPSTDKSITMQRLY